jgi:hypothetical protein
MSITPNEVEILKTLGVAFVGASFAYYFALKVANNQFNQDLKLKAMFSTIDALHELDKTLDRARRVWIQVVSGATVILTLKDLKSDGLDIQKSFFDELIAFFQAIEEIPSVVTLVYFYQIISEVPTEDIEFSKKGLLELVKPLEKLGPSLGGESQLQRKAKAKAVIAVNDDMNKAISEAKLIVSAHLASVNQLDLVSLANAKRRFRALKRYIKHNPRK